MGNCKSKKASNKYIDERPINITLNNRSVKEGPKQLD